VQLVSFTRSAILATGLVIVYLSSRLLNTVMVALVLAFALGAMAVAYSTSYTIENRVDESLKDITSSLEGNFVTFRAQTDGNLAFRLAHLNERLSFVANDIKRWPIGVGFIHEDSAVAQALGFKTGLPNPLTGRAFQVDTGDIAWSVIVIKTGFLGLFFLLLFLLLSYFSVGPTNGKYTVVYRAGLLYFMVTSFFSINFSTPSFMIPPMLFLALAINEKQQLTSDSALPK
jgi:type IV secretory pathway VirB2 component (pilin)